MNKLMILSSLLILFIFISNNYSFGQSPTITLGTNPTVCQGTTSANLSYSATTETPDLYSIDYFSTAEAEGFVDVVDASLTVSPIVLIIPAAPTGGIYYGNLKVKNSGTGLSSINYLISVTISGAAPGAITGYTVVNPGISGYEYSIEDVINATDYNWSVPANWTINSGQGTTSILVTSSSNLSDDGNITVSATTVLCGVSPVSTLFVNVDDVTDHSDINCTSCHTLHNATGSTLTNASANEGLCLSCHVIGQIAERKDFAAGDKAIPGTSGNSHSWDALAINSTYETNLPTNTEMAARLTVGDSIVCSTCHDQHNSALASPYLRVDNTDDAMCKDCHSARDVGLYTDVTPGYGSHPVGVVLDTIGVRFGESPTLAAHNDKVQCSTCHGVHDISGGTLTTDGYLLKMPNDNNLCLDCHAYSSHQSQTCITCHQVHNTNKSNIYMIRDVITTPSSGNKTVVFTGETGTNSFADGDGTYNGVCEVCHTTTSYHTNTNDGVNHNDATDCSACHTHSSGFSGGDCITCHQDNYPNWNVSDAHVAHTTQYSYICSTCHNNNNHNDGTVDIEFNLSGLATRNGADSNTPTWTSGSKTCSNIYCHSDGRSAYRGTDGTYTWSSTTGSQTPIYAAIPTWDSGTNISCGSVATPDPNNTFACHPGPSGVEAVPNYLINATNHGSMINSNTLYPATGSHAPLRNAHYTNSQNLSTNGWARVQCFYCHETDDVPTPAPNEKYQGTYGTSLHVDGETHFNPRWHSNNGTMVNTITYSYEGTAAHCGAGKTCW